MLEGMDPAKDVDQANRNPEDTVDSVVQDVRVAVSLGNFGEELQVVLQRVPLLADTLVKHSRSGLHSTPDHSALGVLDCDYMALLMEEAGNHIVRSGVKGATGPRLGDEGIEENGVLEDGCASQPVTASQAPCPFVCDPAGSATTAAVEKELGTCQKRMSAGVSSKESGGI